MQIAMPILVIFIVVSLVVLYLTVTRSKGNIARLTSLLQQPQVKGSTFWGATIRGTFNGREVLCLTHSKATQLYMNADERTPLHVNRYFSLPLFWPRITENCLYHKGKIYYAGLGIIAADFYYKNLSEERFKEILSEMSEAADIMRVTKEGELPTFSLTNIHPKMIIPVLFLSVWVVVMIALFLR